MIWLPEDSWLKVIHWKSCRCCTDSFVIAGLIGVDANSFVAGLGVTGLVIAEGVDSVANMFGAISIPVDQPFNVEIDNC